MPNQNTEYERFVRDVMEALLRAQGLETVKVEHDVQLEGLSRTRQIDVYWEYRLGGVLHRVIMNCKRYRDTVEVGDVEALGGVLADMPGVRGIIVTTKGYQQGAVDYATKHQIGLKIIRPPIDADWDGRLRTIELHIRIDMPVLLGVETKIDLEWVKANISASPESITGSSQIDGRRVAVRDLKTDTVESMSDLWNRLMRENPTEAGHENRATVRWEDARLERPGAPALKVVQMTFHWKVEMGQTTERTVVQKDPSAIVRDAIDGTLLFVDPDGTITGDVEAEFGSRPVRK